MPEPGQLLRRVTDSTAIADLHKSTLDSVSEEEKLKNAPPVPGLGNQIQDFSIVGQTPEATVDILWKEEAGAYADGTPYRLRSPQFNVTNLLQQSADAYLNDMGITSPLFPAEDGSAEIDQETLVAAAAYAQTLAAPARMLVNDPQVKHGENLFSDANCATCHVSGFKTGEHKYPALENQVIHPYTDMLLHDMGEGLADNRADFDATGAEWRTPSLWGVGLAQTVLPYSGYLHDGRARTFEEAILWHGGEAETSKAAFENMSQADRDALVKFLQSL